MCGSLQIFPEEITVFLSKPSFNVKTQVFMGKVSQCSLQLKKDYHNKAKKETLQTTEIGNGIIHSYQLTSEKKNG